MDSNRLEVQKFIENQFKIEGWTVHEFPVLPGGVILEDKVGSTMYIWYDFIKQQVMWR